jgi:preprotein translocase subunit YajC
MILLEVPDANSTTFKVLLIASEIIIPLIVFVGAYYFFKPVFDKQEKELKEKKELEDKIKNESSET